MVSLMLCPSGPSFYPYLLSVLFYGMLGGRKFYEKEKIFPNYQGLCRGVALVSRVVLHAPLHFQCLSLSRTLLDATKKCRECAPGVFMICLTRRCAVYAQNFVANATEAQLSDSLVRGMHQFEDVRETI